VNRGLLIVLQVVGAITIVPYPFVILANVMSIAAPGQTLFGAIPFILLSIYPAVWLGLYVLAWRFLVTGSTGLAFALSSVPVLAGLCAVAFFVQSDKAVTTHYAKSAEKTRSEVEPLNPLMWKIMCSGGPNRIQGAPVVTADQVVAAIEANPGLVNVEVHGTPLRAALLNGAFNIDGTLGNDKREPPQHQQDMIRIVRTLVAHGAHLNAEERSDLGRTWQLRRAMLDGPITTENENSLVWKILGRNHQNDSLFKVTTGETPLINKPTRLHGTPMYAALLTGGFYIYPELAKAGAHLSPEEERDPAAVKALADLRQKRAAFEGH
jgi:hypothetical protein